MFKPTRHHFNLKNWIDNLKKNIEHSTYLINTYPDDPRCMQEVSMLNVYEKIYNLLTGSDDVTLLEEDYQVMVRIGQEAMTMNKFKKITSEVQEDVVISQTQIVHAPELTGNVDVYAMEDQLHLENMEETPVIKKKTKKVKTK